MSRDYSPVSRPKHLERTVFGLVKRPSNGLCFVPFFEAFTEGVKMYDKVL